MKTYKTSQVAALIGIHPNTVRLYEEVELIPRPERLGNGYRVFTEFHIEQFRLARLGFQVEVLQNGIRKKVIQLVKTSAAGDFDGALQLAGEYLEMVGWNIAMRRRPLNWRSRFCMAWNRRSFLGGS